MGCFLFPRGTAFCPRLPFFARILCPAFDEWDPRRCPGDFAGPERTATVTPAGNGGVYPGLFPDTTRGKATCASIVVPVCRVTSPSPACAGFPWLMAAGAIALPDTASLSSTGELLCVKSFPSNKPNESGRAIKTSIDSDTVIFFLACHEPYSQRLLYAARLSSLLRCTTCIVGSESVTGSGKTSCLPPPIKACVYARAIACASGKRCCGFLSNARRITCSTAREICGFKDEGGSGGSCACFQQIASASVPVKGSRPVNI